MPSRLELAFCVDPREAIIDVFDIHTGLLHKHIKVGAASSHSANIGFIALLHDSYLMVVDKHKNIVYALNWRLNRMKWKFTLPAMTSANRTQNTRISNLSTIAITNNCKFFCLSTKTGYIYVWCLLTGKLLKIFKAHLNKINKMVFNGDNSCLVSAGNDCVIKCWKLLDIVSLATAQPRPRSQQTQTQNNNNNNSNSSNSTHSNSNSVQEWIAFKDHMLPVIDIHCPANNNQRIFSSSMDCTIKMYCMLSRTLLNSISFPNAITCLKCDISCSYLLCGSKSGELFRIDLLRHSSNAADIQNIIDMDGNTQLADVCIDIQKSGRHSSHGNSHPSSSTTTVVAITGLDISYDGHLCVVSHSNGVASIWDIKYGSKVRILNKQRACYSQIIAHCDRLGAFANLSRFSGGSASDVKYEKLSLPTKNFPIIFERFFAEDIHEDANANANANANAISNKNNNNKSSSDGSKQQRRIQNENANHLVLPPAYMAINVSSGLSCAAQDLGLNQMQQMSHQRLFDAFDNNVSQSSSAVNFQNTSEKYGINAYNSDFNFLARVDQQCAHLSSASNFGDVFNENGEHDHNQMNFNNSSIIMEENQKLKAEILQWKDLHQSLYNYTVNKVIGHQQ